MPLDTSKHTQLVTIQRQQCSSICNLQGGRDAPVQGHLLLQLQPPGVGLPAPLLPLLPLLPEGLPLRRRALQTK